MRGGGLRGFLRHGLALDPPPPDPELDAFMEALAEEIARRRLAPFAVLMLASGLPLAFVAAQLLLFAEPVVQALFPTRSYRRVATLLEDRDRVERFIARIEARQAEREELTGAPGVRPPPARSARAGSRPDRRGRRA